jgi:hypothetical protein
VSDAAKTLNIITPGEADNDQVVMHVVLPTREKTVINRKKAKKWRSCKRRAIALYKMQI